MSIVRAQLVDVYPYRWREDRVEFLLFRRAPGTLYAGQWRMVGGKVEPEEQAWQAAVREFKEETGAIPEVCWCVPTLNHFYEWSSDTVHLIPAFAIEWPSDAVPVLNAEHDQYWWGSREEAIQRLCWPEQQRLVAIIERYLKTGTCWLQWVIPSAQIRLFLMGKQE